jgi:transposase
MKLLKISKDSQIMNCTPNFRHSLKFGGAFLMAKFTIEEKIKAVKRYLEGDKGCQTIAKEIGVHKSKVQFWIRKYEYHGENAFFKSYTNYSLNYKLDVLKYMNDNGTSIFETAAIFNLPSASTLWNWHRLFETQGSAALKPKKKGRSNMKKKNQKASKKAAPTEGSIQALQQELEELRMENAYLKKLNALVQNKEKSPNKTKRK